MDPNEDMDGAGVTKLMCTPRSWTNAMRELAGYSHTGTLEGFTIFDIDRDILAMTLNQYVPAKAVDSFLAFLEVISKIGDFDAAVRDIWKNGGKKFKLAKKDLNKISIPLAQLICSSHSDKLPTEKEFESLCEWMVAQDSDQLASFVLDVFKNVFCDAVDANKRDALFVVQTKRAKIGNDKDGKWLIIRDLLDPVAKRWGITMEDFPDWDKGRKLLIKKYGESFVNTKIDGVEAFG